MDKYEFNIKLEQIKKMVGKGDYETAMKIADSIDWRRVRNTNILSMVATIYEKNKDYQEAKEILLLAFERAPIGKRLIYKLTELAVKEGNVEEAEAYYREFCNLTSEDPRQYLLRYMILKAKGAPAQQLIHSLESYTNVEMEEKWMFELAQLYSLSGMETKCVSMCDKIMLMYGLGQYVEKAMELKLQYAPLTSYQMDLVENRDKYEAKLRAVEEQYSGGLMVGGHMEKKEAVIEEVAVSSVEDAEAVAVEIAAKMEEAEIQKNLAEEMSKLSEEETSFQESDAEKTRVLDDIRRIGSLAVTQMTMADEKEAYQETQEPERETLQDNEEKDPVIIEDLIDESELESEEGHFEESHDELSYNHLMIEAQNPEKGVQIAVSALKQIHQETGVKNSAIKISGEKLSLKGVFRSEEKLKGKDLIIESAGGLTPDAIDELYSLMSQEVSSMIVVLIDSPLEIQRFHEKYPVFAKMFEYVGSRADEAGLQSAKPAPISVAEQSPVVTPVVNTPVSPVFENPDAGIRMSQEQEELDIDRFAQYACKYANEIDCNISGKSMLALYERIEIMEEDGLALTRENAEILIEEAADRAERPSFGHMIKGIFSSKYDKDGMLVLKEEHFIY